MATVSSWMCDTCLIWTVVNVLFLWSPIYNTKKALIDNVLNQVKENAKGILGKAESFIPRYREEASKKRN